MLRAYATALGSVWMRVASIFSTLVMVIFICSPPSRVSAGMLTRGAEAALKWRSSAKFRLFRKSGQPGAVALTAQLRGLRLHPLRLRTVAADGASLEKFPLRHCLVLRHVVVSNGSGSRDLALEDSQ